MENRFKFRVWSVKYRKFVDCYCMDNLSLQVCINHDFQMATQQNQMIIQQCLGLKDVKGKCVYEGDIIKTPQGNCLKIVWGDYGSFHTVSMDEFEEILYLYELEYAIEQCEIIGNIYEEQK